MNSPSRTCLSVGGPLPPPPPPPISTSTWKEDYCASLPAVSTLLLEPSFVCELFLSVRHSHQACAPFSGKWYRLQEVSSEPKTNFCDLDDLEDTQFLAETHPYTHTTHTHTLSLSLLLYTHSSSSYSYVNDVFAIPARLLVVDLPKLRDAMRYSN